MQSYIPFYEKPIIGKMKKTNASTTQKSKQEEDAKQKPLTFHLK